MQSQFDLIDPDPIAFSFDCLRATQPVGDIFIASIPHNIITKIAYFDVRRVIQTERDVERYLGIQRPLDNKRVKELENYVNYYDASFPTAIIIAVDEPFAEYDETTKRLTLTNVPRGETKPTIAISNLARVIDGQHRIAGLLEFTGESFDVPVSIFVGADVADQAHIFSTVNLEQTKVNKSLVYDLYSLAKSRSPQKTCHNIVVALDQDETSPFFHRIKRLGTTTIQGRFEPISQAGFVEMLMRFISADPKTDRDSLLRGRALRRAAGDEIWKYPFRNMFIDGKDVQIADAIYRYFNIVRDRWSTAWNNKERNGTVLNRTNGFRALMRTYGELYGRQRLAADSINADFLRTHFENVELDDADFNIENFPPGSTGESRLFRVLTNEARLQDLEPV